MAEKDEIITFTGDNGDEINFRVLEQTKLNGCNYLLVIDTNESGEDTALIMKEVTTDGKDELTYEIVENDDEIDAIARVFEGILEDVSLV